MSQEEVKKSKGKTASKKEMRGRRKEQAQAEIDRK